MSSIQLGSIETFCPLKYFLVLGSIKKHWAEKIRQEKLPKFIKLLDYNKSSCLIFCVKMSQYSQYLQNELKHFDLEILVVYWELGHFEPYQVFMNNFFAKLF